MAMIGDELTRLTGVAATDRRFENWLYMHLMGRGFKPTLTRGQYRRGKMVAFIRDQNLNAKDLRQKFDEATVPDELLRWIEDDSWQCLWLQRRLNHRDTMIDTLDHLTYRDKSILRVDTPYYIKGIGADRLQSLENEWRKQVVQDKKYQWFFKEDQDRRLLMLTQWVNQNRAMLEPELVQMTRFTVPPEPVPYEFYDRLDVMQFFSDLSLTNAKLCLEAVKKRWSQVKYRENLKGKHQCNVVLTDKSLKLLDKIGDRHLLSRAQVLEILIRSEAEQKCYVSGWIKVAKSLE